MKFVIPNIVFVILIAFLTIWLTFLTTKGSLTNNSYNGFFRKLTSRGRLVFYVLIGITSLLIWQELNNNNLISNQEIKFKMERDIRDEKITEGIKQGVDSISSKLYDDISIAFSKQGYKIDTLKQEIVKTKILGFKSVQPIPVLTIDSTGIFLQSENDSIKKFKITIKSSLASSTNFNILCKVLTQYGDNSYRLSLINFFPDNKILPKDSKWIVGLNNSSSKEILNIFLLFKGTYTSIDGLVECEINDLYRFDMKTKHTSEPLNRLRKEVLEIIEKTPVTYNDSQY